MKKIIVVLTITVFAFASCKKEEQVGPIKKQSIQMAGGKTNMSGMD